VGDKKVVMDQFLIISELRTMVDTCTYYDFVTIVQFKLWFRADALELGGSKVLFFRHSRLLKTKIHNQCVKVCFTFLLEDSFIHLVHLAGWPWRSPSSPSRGIHNESNLVEVCLQSAQQLGMETSCMSFCV
jgi:hypothetical protein